MVRRKDDLDLVELAAGGTGKMQFSRGFGEFDFRRLTAGRVRTAHLFLEAGHSIPRLRFFPARP